MMEQIYIALSRRARMTRRRVLTSHGATSAVLIFIFLFHTSCAMPGPTQLPDSRQGELSSNLLA